jgi:hypothetical protein
LIFNIFVLKNICRRTSGGDAAWPIFVLGEEAYFASHSPAGNLGVYVEVFQSVTNYVKQHDGNLFPVLHRSWPKSQKISIFILIITLTASSIIITTALSSN